MAIEMKPGMRLFSRVCSTELIVVKAPAGAIDLTIGGAPPVLSADDRDESARLSKSDDGGSAMGKRYVDNTGEVEVLCTKAGAGSPAIGGTALAVKEAKPLPASD